ncbi:hypothetical protein AWR36_008515 [Microbulbifer flavimaris]|uniref:Uncharacterized protein n=1 Tax=Microbulbifer flavimaris TaxID=1781068 RepID=A0ABX4I298_9GAMM|nr:hypothetical protein AVO43_08485 [Microbulbifer sp. ZGT114]PCO06025.1 hypothetical protein AWR36_008515 [Microbulbifer flavimaris]
MKAFRSTWIGITLYFAAGLSFADEKNQELLKGTYCEKHAQAAGSAAVMRMAERMSKEPKNEAAQLEFALAMASTYQEQLDLDEEAAIALFAYPYRAQVHPNFLLDSRAHRHLFFNLCKAEIPVTAVKNLDRASAAACFDKARSAGRLNDVDPCIVALFEAEDKNQKLPD